MFSLGQRHMLSILLANTENICGWIEYLGNISVHTNSKQIAIMLYEGYINKYH